MRLCHGNVPVMNWSSDSNVDKPTLPTIVLQHCSDMFLSDEVTEIEGFTQFKKTIDQKLCTFRANPSHMSSSNPDEPAKTWCDWAEFEHTDGHNEEQVAPAQILCFLNVTEAHASKQLRPPIAGLRAVVRSFEKPPVQNPPSSIVRVGKLQNTLINHPCDSIFGTVVVVPNIPDTGDVKEAEKFFVVKNRDHWLFQFHRKLSDHHII